MAAAHDRGKKALETKDFHKAIEEFTSAIKSNPEAPSYYLDRSSAYSRSSSEAGAKALLDAEAGLVLAKARERGHIIGKAQFRRAVVLFQLGRYKDAERCFAWSKEKDPSEKMLGIWEVKVKTKVDAGEGPELGIEQYPNKSVVKQAQGEDVGSSTVEATKTTSTSSSATTAATSSPKPAAVTTPPSQIRHDWYQSSDTVTLSLMVKGVPKDKAVVEIDKGSVSISFPLPTGSDYSFSLDPLFAAVDPTQSSFKILSTKIELVLKKASLGTKWHSLEGTSAIDKDAKTEDTPKPIPQAVVQGPSYPTSSKSGPKDWDKLARDLSKKPAAKSEDNTDNEAKTTEDEAYISDDEGGGDPVNGFFKKLFKNADPDTKRAMMKSYTESNGTALSTNWAEVKQGKVETKPPDGMEAKEWEN